MTIDTLRSTVERFSNARKMALQQCGAKCDRPCDECLQRCLAALKPSEKSEHPKEENVA